MKKNQKLYIFIFLHQTTTAPLRSPYPQGCISLYSYIKPQLSSLSKTLVLVVYLYIPTSNHNVLYSMPLHRTLYIFIFLHQTTTKDEEDVIRHGLYIFIFLHQTTTTKLKNKVSRSCISLYSYIKPQPKETNILIIR